MDEPAVRRDALPLDELLERHLPELREFVRRRAFRLVTARESATDLAQSVCREVIQHLDRFTHGEEEEFKHWLYRTAERKLVNRFRYYTARKRRQPDGPAPEPLMPATPSHRAMAREELAAAERSLAALPEDSRRAIVMSRLEGLPYSEIARRLRRSEGAVRNLVYRGLARMAEELGEAGPAPASG